MSRSSLQRVMINLFAYASRLAPRSALSPRRDTGQTTESNPIPIRQPEGGPMATHTKKGNKYKKWNNKKENNTVDSCSYALADWVRATCFRSQGERKMDGGGCSVSRDGNGIARRFFCYSFAAAGVTKLALINHLSGSLARPWPLSCRKKMSRFTTAN